MRKMLLFCAVALLLSCSAALAEDLTPEKRQDVARFLEISGHRAMGLQMLQTYLKQSLGLVKKIRQDIPASSLPTVERELSALIAEKYDGPGGLFEQIVPLCAKHFSHAEVRQLLAFYESPVGRKTVAVMPQMVKESSETAQRMGVSLIPEINRRISEAVARDARAREGQNATQQ